jgi:hypothetical protein
LTSGGVLSGKPTAAGTFSFTITITDSSTGTGPYTLTRTFKLTVHPAGAAPMLTATGFLPGSGVPFTGDMAAYMNWWEIERDRWLEGQG